MPVIDGTTITATQLNSELDAVRTTLVGSTVNMNSINYVAIDISGINQDTPLSEGFMSVRNWVPPVDAEIVYISLVSYTDYVAPAQGTLTIDGNINEPIVLPITIAASTTLNRALWLPPAGTLFSVIAGDNLSFTYITNAPVNRQMTIFIGLRSPWTKF